MMSLTFFVSDSNKDMKKKENLYTNIPVCCMFVYINNVCIMENYHHVVRAI